MTKLTIFCRQALVDTYVTLRLTRGEDVSGHITELDDTTGVQIASTGGDTSRMCIG